MLYGCNRERIWSKFGYLKNWMVMIKHMNCIDELPLSTNFLPETFDQLKLLLPASTSFSPIHNIGVGPWALINITMVLTTETTRRYCDSSSDSEPAEFPAVVPSGAQISIHSQKSGTLWKTNINMGNVNGKSHYKWAMFNSHVKFSEWSEIPGGNTCDEAAAMFTAGLMFGFFFV